MRSTSLQPGASSGARPGSAFWRGALVGLAPLAALALILALAAGLAALTRALWAPSGFVVWQGFVTGVWVGGLIIAALVFSYAVYRVLRSVTEWRREGLTSQAAGAYWALGFTALAILLPVLIAIILPQHPAPPRAP